MLAGCRDDFRLVAAQEGVGEFFLRDLAQNYKAKVLWVNIEHKENSREYRLRILGE